MADRRELCVGGKPLSSLRVVDLKVELEKRSLPKSGSKKELLERLRLHLQLEETREAALKDEDHVPNLSLCNETENDFVREYLAAQQARFQVQKEAKKQYEEKVRESEASAEETTQDEDEPSDYSPARKSSPRKSSRSKRKEDLTSTPMAHKVASKFQTPGSLANPREEETPSQDGDTTEEEEARTPRTRKHKLLKYVQTPTGSERKQPGNSVTGQGQVEQLHAGRRDPPPSQLYGDAGVASSTDAKNSHSALPGSSSKTSSSAESSESESVFPRLVDVWSEKEKRSEDQTSVPESIPKDEEKPQVVESVKKSSKKTKPEESTKVDSVSETKSVEAQEATKEEPSPVKLVEEPAPVVSEEATKEESSSVKLVEEPAPVVPEEATKEEPSPVKVVEEPAPVVSEEATKEEPSPVKVVEEPAPVVSEEATKEESSPVKLVEEPAPVVSEEAKEEEPSLGKLAEEQVPVVSAEAKEEEPSPVKSGEEQASVVSGRITKEESSLETIEPATKEESASVISEEAAKEEPSPEKLAEKQESVFSEEATKEEPSLAKVAEEPVSVVSSVGRKELTREVLEEEENTPKFVAENSKESEAVVSAQHENKDHKIQENAIEDTAPEISIQDNSEESVGEGADSSTEKILVEHAGNQEESGEHADDGKDFKEEKEQHVETNKPSREERTATPGPVEDVLTIEAEPEALDQPDSSESKEAVPENRNVETPQMIPSMAIEKERSPQPKARSESLPEDKTEQLDGDAQQTSDNEEDEIQVDASELIDDSLKITDAEEGELEKQEQGKSHSSSTSRSESRNSGEERNSTREKETTPLKTEQKTESPDISETSKLEPVRKLKIKKFLPQSEVEPTEATENGMLRKRKWGTSNLLPSKKPTLVISTDSLKAIVPDAKPLSAEEVRLGSPNLQFAKQTVVASADEEEKQSSKPEKPEVVRRVAVEVAEAIAPAKPEAVIAAAAPLLEATSPSQQPRTCVLQVSNLVRPFTVNQLKDLLARTGHLVDGKFWIDKVKSTCLVQYETEEEAEETRTALHGIHWPTSNPKTLIVDFSTVEQLDNRMAGKLVPSSFQAKVEQSVRGPALAPAPVDEGKRERPEKVREWDLGKVSEADADKEKFGKENRTVDEDFAEVKSKDDVPAKLLDDLFRKTKVTPCVYWLPLTDAQIAEKEEMRRQRIAEREKREREVKQRKEEEFQERQREREKQRENERERQRAREKERERERDRQRSRKRSHSSSSSSSSESSSRSPAKRRSSKTPPRRR